MSEWKTIDSAPKDGSEMILAILGAGAKTHWVHVGWYEVGDPFPWRFIDTFDLTPTGCCNSEDEDRITANGARAEGVTHWMPLPRLPIMEIPMDNNPKVMTIEQQALALVNEFLAHARSGAAFNYPLGSLQRLEELQAALAKHGLAIRKEAVS